MRDLDELLRFARTEVARLRRWHRDEELEIAGLRREARALPSRLAGELVRARKRGGWTQAQVARRMGVTRSVVARLETGRLNPRLDTVARYAAAVRLTLAVAPLRGVRFNRKPMLPDVVKERGGDP
jgi:DNA-binding XRE family transcriptional regulator